MWVVHQPGRHRDLPLRIPQCGWYTNRAGPGACPYDCTPNLSTCFVGNWPALTPDPCYAVRSVAGPEAGTGAPDLAWAGRYHMGRPAMMSGTPATSPNTSEE